ncbi:hypothetical protein [Marinicrinis sediminis]|uniref:Cellulose biosynthesis protein BcsQ n=1 Tax=Marinicrinis sediminis TaxID=1652465 RepID=A0ABW5RCU8_9BACL
MTAPDNRGALIAFTGATPNTGCTSAAYLTAAQLAKWTGKRVGYVCLNLKSSKIHRYLGVDEPEYRLDHLKAELKSGTLTPGMLLHRCWQPDSSTDLHVLFGNSQRNQAELYVPGHIEHLLDIAQQTFAYTLVETNAYWDNAATLIALQQAAARMMVVTNEITSFQEDVMAWTREGSQLFHIPQAAMNLLVYECRAEGFSRQDIERETGMKVIQTLRYSDRVKQHLDEGKLAHLPDQLPYAQPFQRIALAILHQLDQPAEEIERAMERSAYSLFQRLLRSLKGLKRPRGGINHEYPKA